MRRVSIRDLHQHTGRLVRLAREETLCITERGVPVAVLCVPAASGMPGKPFPKRRLSSLPKVPVDSTTYISEEREGR
jgi:prevent-host-death family protein